MRALERLVCERLPSAKDIDCVVPVALHRSRLAERGFDQAVRLAVAIAGALDRRLVFALERTRVTEKLARMDAASRWVAVEGAFVASPRVAGLRVLLVDDVHTTGATLRAAKSALAGIATEARAHVLAATPRG